MTPSFVPINQSPFCDKYKSIYLEKNSQDYSDRSNSYAVQGLVLNLLPCQMACMRAAS